MPFIDLKTNVEISKEKEKTLKEEIGASLSIIGKSENWVMINIEDNKRLYFAGENNYPIAFVGVDILGTAEKNAYNMLTKRITEVINSNLDISKDKIYIRYSEYTNWGWNGSNF